jgi:hypothetical protein
VNTTRPAAGPGGNACAGCGAQCHARCTLAVTVTVRRSPSGIRQDYFLPSQLGFGLSQLALYDLCHLQASRRLGVIRPGRPVAGPQPVAEPVAGPRELRDTWATCAALPSNLSTTQLLCYPRGAEASSGERACRPSEKTHVGCFCMGQGRTGCSTLHQPARPPRTSAECVTVPM